MCCLWEVGWVGYADDGEQRGYLENLEVKVQELEDRNKELSAALLAAQASVARVSQPIGYTTYEQDWAVNGVPKPAPRMLAPNQFSASAPPANEYHPMNGTSAPGPKTKTTAPHGISFPIRKASSHYLGISAGNSYLSSMKEAALSILGIDIDLSDLNPSEPAGRNDSQRLDDSYGSCLATVFNCGTGVQRPELPPKEEGLKHIMYYFMISHAYLPILHQPTFLKMVRGVWDAIDSGLCC